VYKKAALFRGGFFVDFSVPNFTIDPDLLKLVFAIAKHFI